MISSASDIAVCGAGVYGNSWSRCCSLGGVCCSRSNIALLVRSDHCGSCMREVLDLSMWLDSRLCGLCLVSCAACSITGGDNVATFLETLYHVSRTSFYVSNIQSEDFNFGYMSYTSFVCLIFVR